MADYEDVPAVVLFAELFYAVKDFYASVEALLGGFQWGWEDLVEDL